MSNGNSSGDNSTSVVAMVAIIILVGLAIVFFVYVLPSLQKNGQQQTPNQQSDTKVEINTPPIGGTQPSAQTGN